MLATGDGRNGALVQRSDIIKIDYHKGASMPDIKQLRITGSGRHVVEDADSIRVRP